MLLERWWANRPCSGIFCEPVADLSPVMIGLEDCDSLLSHTNTTKAIAGKHSVRNFSSLQQFLEQGALGNIYWLPRMVKSADGLTKERSDMAPLFPPLDSGKFSPGSLRPLRGIQSNETGGSGRTCSFSSNFLRNTSFHTFILSGFCLLLS